MLKEITDKCSHGKEKLLSPETGKGGSEGEVNTLGLPMNDETGQIIGQPKIKYIEGKDQNEDTLFLVDQQDSVVLYANRALRMRVDAPKGTTSKGSSPPSKKEEVFNSSKLSNT